MRVSQPPFASLSAALAAGVSLRPSTPQLATSETSSEVVLSERALAMRLTLAPRHGVGALTVIPAALVVSSDSPWDPRELALAVEPDSRALSRFEPAALSSRAAADRELPPTSAAAGRGPQAEQPAPAPMAAAWEVLQQNRRFAREQADRQQRSEHDGAQAPLRRAFSRIA